MNTRTITISKVNGKTQHLSDVLPLIPSNSIICKTLTGIGATHCEIKARRHSVIIEPNKPIIYGKTNNPMHKKDNLKGVYQGVYTDEIIDYLQATLDSKKYIKIMTTPESFHKVQDAFEAVDLDVRFDCFLLFDECHKIIKDCDYREDITLPMDLFFQSANKALVSATPPSEFMDKRFSSFTKIDFKPDFDFSKEISLITTNNVLQTVRKTISLLLKEEEPIFIFVNSTDMIYSLMNQLELFDDSAVFCSDKSVDRLKEMSFRKAYEDWGNTKMEKVNWMTSRFYNALDIELETSPNVLMVTDSTVADWTMFDPNTDSVQIVGRFRNGVNKIYHISNVDENIPVHDRQFFINKFNSSKEIYSMMRRFYEDAPTPEHREAYYDAMQVLPYTKFLDVRGKENCFLIDNSIDEDMVKTFYHSSSTLANSYGGSSHFEVNHSHEDYSLSDMDRLKISSKTKSIMEKRKLIVEQLEILGECETELENQFKRDLYHADPFIVKAYDIIGKEEVEKLGYSVSLIRQAMIIKQHKEKASSTDVIKLVNSVFRTNKWYSAAYIKEQLRQIYNTLDVPHPKAITSHTIKEYFVASEKKEKNSRGYYLLSPKFKESIHF